jgi:DNA-binding MarR family transcriptional regulator
MNARGLLLLSRKLMQIAEAALPQNNKPPTSVRLVLIDVAYHPGSSISEITDRTGFPQSLVSMSVAKLRDLGVVATEPDPTDRRRTLVRPTTRMQTMAQERGETCIEAALTNALTVADDGQLTAALAALDVLARLLVPEVLTDDTQDPATTSAADQQ